MAKGKHLRAMPLPVLLRSYLVYALSSSGFIVEQSPKIISALETVRDTVPLVGPLVWSTFAGVMRNTFFAHYVGGETVPGCFGLMDELEKEGCSAMLNYSVEKDASTAAQSGIIDENVEEIHRAIVASGHAGRARSTWVAIKITGLVHNPGLIQRASEALASSTAYQRGQLAVSADTLFPAGPALSEQDHVDLDSLLEGLRKACSQAKALGVRVAIDSEQSWYHPAIDHIHDLLAIEFNRVEAPPDLRKPGFLARWIWGDRIPLTPSSVPPTVFNTFQCYRKDTEERLSISLARSVQLNHSLGVKLVRGAYADTERARALAAGLKTSPVWDSKPETDACYDRCAAICVERVDHDLNTARGQWSPGIGILIATHNATSVKRMLTDLRARKLIMNAGARLDVSEEVRGRICFAQLLGMSDALTFALSQLFSGSETVPSYNTATSISPYPVSPLPIVAKYIPYGPLDRALPYLIRRAQENRSVLTGADGSGRGGASDERRLIGAEIRRRFL
ncbi:uncharacterized protein L969DRAFT_88641 [Mixia osmundae IAM 14324]|nr:uncharacterized protein L969DRAFT_88641 [Mixia osmundae IAM 14324]KEI38199.1 hypothetical protein L969DRAFT_88641 [Mixia osmundae IAM 14324]